MKKVICIIFFVVGVLNICISQNNKIKFSVKEIFYTHKKSVKIEAYNDSKRIIYYCIGVRAFTDTGYVGLTANIDAIGKIDFLALKKLNVNSKVVKYVSKKSIATIYNYISIKKLQFYLLVHYKKDFNSK